MHWVVLVCRDWILQWSPALRTNLLQISSLRLALPFASADLFCLLLLSSLHYLFSRCQISLCFWQHRFWAVVIGFPLSPVAGAYDIITSMSLLIANQCQLQILQTAARPLTYSQLAQLISDFWFNKIISNFNSSVRVETLIRLIIHSFTCPSKLKWNTTKAKTY